MANLTAPRALFWLLAAPIFLTGCHSSREQVSVFKGDWKLTAPVLGQASVSFDNSQFTEKWSVSTDRDAGELVVSGPYQVSGDSLILNPKQFQIIGPTSDELNTLEDDLKVADAWIYSVKWSGNDLAYLTATGSKESTVVLGMYRGDAKPNERRLEFSLVWPGSQQTISQPVRINPPLSPAPLNPASNSNGAPQIAGGLQPDRLSNGSDSSQSVTIITGAGNQDDGGQGQDPAHSQDPVPADSSKDDSAPGDGQVQRF